MIWFILTVIVVSIEVQLLFNYFHLREELEVNQIFISNIKHDLTFETDKFFGLKMLSEKNSDLENSLMSANLKIEKLEEYLNVSLSTKPQKTYYSKIKSEV